MPRGLDWDNGWEVKLDPNLRPDGILAKYSASRLLTPKQIKFCQLYVELGIGADAYLQSYNATTTRAGASLRASERLKQPKIVAYINELKADMQKKHQITVDSLVEELEEARKAALGAETPQTSSAVSATMGKAKLTGLDKNTIEVVGAGGGPIQIASLNISGMSDEDLAAARALFSKYNQK